MCGQMQQESCHYLWKAFSSKHPEIKISLSSFIALRPANVRR